MLADGRFAPLAQLGQHLASDDALVIAHAAAEERRWREAAPKVPHSSKFGDLLDTVCQGYSVSLCLWPLLRQSCIFGLDAVEFEPLLDQHFTRHWHCAPAAVQSAGPLYLQGWHRAPSAVQSSSPLYLQGVRLQAARQTEQRLRDVVAATEAPPQPPPTSPLMRRAASYSLTAAGGAGPPAARGAQVQVDERFYIYALAKPHGSCRGPSQSDMHTQTSKRN